MRWINFRDKGLTIVAAGFLMACSIKLIVEGDEIIGVIGVVSSAVALVNLFSKCPEILRRLTQIFTGSFCIIAGVKMAAFSNELPWVVEGTVTTMLGSGLLSWNCCALLDRPSNSSVNNLNLEVEEMGEGKSSHYLRFTDRRPNDPSGSLSGDAMAVVISNS